MFRTWMILGKEELRCNHAGGEEGAVSGHARPSLAFGSGSSRAAAMGRPPTSICGGNRRPAGVLRRGAFSDASRRPVHVQEGGARRGADGLAEKGETIVNPGWKFRVFRYSFLVEEESLVQFDAEGGGGDEDVDGRRRRKVMVVLNPDQRGSSTYEMVVRKERRMSELPI